MNIAIAGISTETNSFNRFHITRKDYFEVYGDELCNKLLQRFPDCPVSGMISYCEENDIGIVPIYVARTLPSGTLIKTEFLSMCEVILSGLKASTAIDAICLDLHGSLYVEDIDDPEGYLLSSITQMYPNVPVHLALDMHATLSDIMVLHSASICAYKTAPHEDMFETGYLCAKTAHTSYSEKQDTCVISFRAPLILSGEISMTTVEPMKGLIKELLKAEELDFVLSASYTLSFPWADSPYMGVSAIISTYKNTMREAEELCRILAKKLWDQRINFNFGMEIVSEIDAIDLMKSNLNSKPVLLSDLGDNATAGASEETVDFLALILEHEIEYCLFALIYDEIAYAQVSRANLGEKISVQLGRFYNTKNQLEIEGVLLKTFTYLDKSAHILRVGTLDIIISEKRMPVADISIFQAANIDIQEYKSIVIKCGYHGEDLCNIASKNILVLSKGDTDPILERIAYTRVPRPIYPIDKEFSWL